MAFSATGKTSSFFLSFLLVVECVGGIELLLQFLVLFLFLVVRVVTLFFEFVPSISTSTSLDRVKSFCYSDNYIDIFVSCILCFHMLLQCVVHALKEPLNETEIAYSGLRQSRPVHD